MKQAYTLREKVHADYSPREGEHIERDYEAGTYTATSIGELELFEHLVTIGLASPAAPAKRTAKGD